jgi:hypothetical protein
MIDEMEKALARFSDFVIGFEKGVWMGMSYET